MTDQTRGAGKSLGWWAAAAVLLAPISPGFANSASPIDDDEAVDLAEAFQPAASAARPDSGISFGRALDITGNPVRLGASRNASIFAGRLSTYTGPFAMPSGSPLRYAALTSSFGMRRHPTLGGMRFHAGLDLAAPTGSPVFATSPGAVMAAGWCGGYGYCVALDNGRGMSTLFGHLSAVEVGPGEVVKAGQQIGRVGSTGRSTGPHLHYEVRRDGRPIDPGSKL